MSAIPSLKAGGGEESKTQASLSFEGKRYIYILSDSEDIITTGLGEHVSVESLTHLRL